MKKIWILVFSMIFMLVAIGDIHAQGRGLFGPKKPIPNTRGKANVKELSKEIHETLQNGNDYRLISFLPNDGELKQLRKDSNSDELNQVLDAIDERKLENKWKEDFAIVLSQLKSDSLNLQNSTIAEVAAGRANSKLPGIYPVTITLTDPKQHTAKLTFQAVRYNKRLYLFQHLEMDKDLQAVNMERAKP